MTRSRHIPKPATTGASVPDIVREYFPRANERTIEHIVWGKTGFPSFWRIGIDGDTPEECFRTQLAREAERLQRGATGCFLCGSDVPLRIGHGEAECPECGGDLDRARRVLMTERRKEFMPPHNADPNDPAWVEAVEPEDLDDLVRFENTVIAAGHTPAAEVYRYPRWFLEDYRDQRPDAPSTHLGSLLMRMHAFRRFLATHEGMWDLFQTLDQNRQDPRFEAVRAVVATAPLGPDFEFPSQTFEPILGPAKKIADGPE